MVQEEFLQSSSDSPCNLQDDDTKKFLVWYT